MESLESRFGTLEEHLKTDYEKLASFAGVPFFIFPYDPVLERKVIEEVNRLQKRLERAGLDVEKVSLGALFFGTLKAKGYLEKSFEIESKDRGALKRGIVSVVKDSLVKDLKGIASDGRKVILIVRAGAIFPFFRTSSILSDLEGSVKSPLVVFYPGRYEDKKLYFLNETEGYYYRAMIL